MPFELAHFGAISAKICAAKEVVKAEPEDACKPLQGQHYDGKFVRVNIKILFLFFVSLPSNIFIDTCQSDIYQTIFMEYSFFFSFFCHKQTQVLVIRGGCMFSAKANHVSNKGGLGVFVINTDEKVEIYQRKMNVSLTHF